METPKAQVPIDDFGGLALDIDEFSLQGGQSHTQTNWALDAQGSMVTRGGYLILSFDNE